uniref:CDP-diacylglycerol--glycerol-3-phosphate 3-phosphatidyltransferase n=1 Tax=Dunaliella tertiolecta TaxID=3047 RepID=A0A7S3QYG4_DUNTE|mmetsp:Transcript_12722/g.34674  ORF Transcript_12722/g.34674 Transcript_12722/m.34674 type:complete len:405 (-) Transcript_12722:412-1626(-)
MAPKPMACAWRIARQLQLSYVASSLQLAQASTTSTPVANYDAWASAKSSTGWQPMPAYTPLVSPSLPPLWSALTRHCHARLHTRAPILQASTAAAVRAQASQHAYSTTASTTTTTTTSHKAPPTAAARTLPQLSVSAPGLATRPEPAMTSKGNVWSLPNMLSIARGLSGPGVAYLILQEQWPWALSALTISGLSDWADGALARRMGCSSVLGSYLDPLGDKVLVGCVVGALAAQGALPSWVATLIIGRDVALVVGMFVVRWQSVGWRTPWSAPPLTRAEFFRTADAAAGPPSPEGQHITGAIEDHSQRQASGETGTEGAPAFTGRQHPGAAPDAGAPFMRPLLISKVNTVLQLLLVGGCVSKAWLLWPQPELLSALEASTAAATALSMGAYGWQAARGHLLAAK